MGEPMEEDREEQILIKISQFSPSEPVCVLKRAESINLHYGIQLAPKFMQLWAVFSGSSLYHIVVICICQCSDTKYQVN